jgi:hypothetical protein
MATSKAGEAVCTYDPGVNSFITKPVAFEGFVES